MNQHEASDCELLELAAKAAGLYVKHEVIDHNDEFTGLRVKPSIYAGRETIVFWNPLTDDGDALRLAVKLGGKFPCFIFGMYGRAKVPHVGASIVHRDGEETYVEQEYEADIGAATRRAIVRAAAEIGRQA